MMMFLLSMIMLVLGCIAYKKNRGIDLLVLFCFIWTVVFAGASLKLYGMRDYSFNTIALFTLGSLSFVIFAAVGRFGKYKQYRIAHGFFSNSLDKSISINKRVLAILLIPVTLFTIYSMTRMLTLVAAGVPLGTIHAMYLGRGGEAFFTILVLNQIHSKLVIPCIYCLAPIIVYYALTDFKKNWLIILIGVIDVTLYVVATGTRVVAIFIFVDILLMLPFSKIVLSKKAFKKIKKIGITLAILLIIALVYYTISRKGFETTTDSSLFSQVFGEVYKYFSLCIPLSDYWLSQIDNLGIVTYGKMSFYGILSFIEWIFAQFFRTGTFAWLDICKSLATELEVMQPIFADAKCNAFVTYLFYFYVDFGVVGVAVLSAIWGFISGNLSKKIRKNHNEATMLFYLLFAQTIAMSFSRWCLFDAPYFLAFFYMRLMFIKSKKKYDESEVKM